MTKDEASAHLIEGCQAASTELITVNRVDLLAALGAEAKEENPADGNKPSK